MPFDGAKPQKAKPQRLGESDQAEGLRRLLVRNQIQVIFTDSHYV